jgi:hypothetical protein
VPELKDIINDIPAELADPGSTDDSAIDTSANDDAEDTSVNDDGAEDLDNQETDDDQDDNTATTDDDGDDEEDDFFVDLDKDDGQSTTPAAPANQPPAGMDSESAYILGNLPKISVRVIVPGADGADEIKTVQAYGWGDLPQNMKGFATVYEQGQFTSGAQNNELKARELQKDYQQQKIKADTDVYVQRENKAIADDLTDLRREGIFPKFKGVPGSKEFNDSAGAKEFDRVIEFMNKQNDEYGKAAQSGRAFRHIGFREAYIMLNGPNQKADQQRDMQARRRAAGKLKGGRGTDANTKVVSTKRVSNITDLADEFTAFTGSSSQ